MYDTRKIRFDQKRMSFARIPETHVERQEQLRTDSQFRNRFQGGHHHQYSVLEIIPVDMIKDFPTSDTLKCKNSLIRSQSILSVSNSGSRMIG